MFLFLFGRLAPAGLGRPSEFLLGFHNRMLNLPETRRTTQLWQSAGPALFGDAGKKQPIFREGAGNCLRYELLKCPSEERMCSLVLRQVFIRGFSMRYVTVLLYDLKKTKGPIILDALTAYHTPPFMSCNSP